MGLANLAAGRYGDRAHRSIFLLILRLGPWSREGHALVASRWVDKLYDWLAKLPSPDAEMILSAGLERAEPPYFERLVELLFERASEAAWAELIANYPRLSPQARARLRADGQQMRAGLARVLRGGSPLGRCNAMQALCDDPAPALAYLLPDVLRTSSGDVRRMAAETLRWLAEFVLDFAKPTEQAGPPRAEPENRIRSESRSEAVARQRADRASVARAVCEALRGFESHYRVEVVEAALWLTRDLGEDLWSVLANRRLPTAHVVSANLKAWDGPRLARFLLEALAQRSWRASAREQLMRWQGPERLAALLRNSDLLERPDFREGLNTLGRPGWFFGLNDLRDLPPELRARAPEWLVLLGYRPEQKRALLAHWSEVAFEELRVAAEAAARAMAQGPECWAVDASTLPREDGA